MAQPIDPKKLPGPPTEAPVTELLQGWRRGDPRAEEALMPLVYAELHRLARIHAGSGEAALQPTEIVNEAYLRLAAGQAEFADRVHFFALAARVMRSVLRPRAGAAAPEAWR